MSAATASDAITKVDLLKIFVATRRWLHYWLHSENLIQNLKINIFVIEHKIWQSSSS